MTSFRSGFIAWAVVAFLSSGFAGCLDSGSKLSMAAPTWESGYTFHYVVQSHGRGTSERNGATQTFTGDSEPYRYVERVINTTQRIGKEPVYVIASIPSEGGSIYHRSYDNFPGVRGPGDKGTFWALRQRDLAFANLDSNDYTGCSYNECGEEEYRLVWRAFSPDTYLDFPLKSGRQWGATTSKEVGVGGLVMKFATNHATASENWRVAPGWLGNLSLETSSKVTGVETVASPAGKVKAERVEIHYNLIGLDAMEEEGRRAIEADGGTAERVEFDLDFSEVLYYSDVFQTHVRQEFHLVLVVATTMTTAEGKRFQGSERYDMTSVVQLERADLEPEPEMDLTPMFPVVMELSQFALALAHQNQTGPVGPPPTVVLRADKALVNVARPETVNFTVSVGGAEKLPEGLSLRWRINDEATGYYLGQDEGFRFSANFTNPGRFVIEAAVHDQWGKRLVTNKTWVTANYAVSGTLACSGFHVLDAAGSCEKEDFPVRPGITRLTVKATPRSDEVPSALAGGQLVVTDSGGREISQADTGDGAEIVVRDFTGYDMVDYRKWLIEWRSRTSTLDKVDFHIDAVYGS